MSHLEPEALVAHAFGDETPEEAAAAARHLVDCAVCRQELAETRGVLEAAASLPVPEPKEGFEDAVWARLESHLPLPSRYSARWPLVAGLAAALLCAFVLGRHTAPSVTPPETSRAAGIPEPVRERILLVAVGDHLERSQMVLVELSNASPSNGRADISAERTLAGHLVEEGRVFRQTAARANEPGVVDMLDELERVLVEVAHGPEEIEGAALLRLQKRIESRGLLFKVRVVGARVRERERDVPRTPVDVQS